MGKETLKRQKYSGMGRWQADLQDDLLFLGGSNESHRLFRVDSVRWLRRRTRVAEGIMRL